MDLVPLLFLLLIVLLSGVIALVADNLGRKLGKKRLWLKWHFLHLRPKHTAMLGVFLSGVVVSFLTIGLVAGLSYDVRTWILRGRRALVDLRVAEDDLHVAEDDLKNARELGAKQAAQNADLEDRVNAGNEKVESQERTISGQRETLLGLQQKIDTSKTQITNLQASVAAVNVRYSELSQKRDRIVRELAVNTRNLASARTNLNATRTSLVATRASLQVALTTQKEAVTKSNELGNRNLEIENKNRLLENKNSALENSVAQLEKDRKVLTEAMEKAENDLNETVGRLASAQEDLSRLVSRYNVESRFFDMIGSTVKQSREAAMTYRRGEEVARATVRANASPEEARKALTVLLSNSRTIAAGRGAAKVGDFDAAGIVNHYDSQMQRAVSAEDIRESLERQLTGKPEPQVIVGASTLNAFVGEPVSLEVSIFPNPLVYREGQVVAEAKVDGKKDQSEIFRQVQTLLAERLTERAKQDRMIPRAGTEAEFGSVTAEEILDLVDRVRKADRRVTLRAMADVDTRAGDPLRLRFGIR